MSYLIRALLALALAAFLWFQAQALAGRPLRRRAFVLAAAALLVLARLVKMDGPPLAGMIAGAQTQPAVLAFAKERTGGSHRVELAYAVIVPAAMIAKIVAATLLVGVG